MNDGQQHKEKGIINIQTAMGLFALLAVVSVLTLKGIALAFALIVIGGLAAKAYVHFLRSRLE
ncbi:MAG TPA: hypothetical protein VH302_15795 [Bryobacteraceae bacterium]|jgi:hypothetical protein|nr:hypothetical protein [Bryobacteraceae bacterium]